MKYIELFAGIGGFRYGLERVCVKRPQQGIQGAGNPQGQPEQCPNQRTNRFTCVWANEIDKYACQVYRKNYGEGEIYEGDITKIETRFIPDHDLLVGGFPCQAFSIAGQRRGFEDTRGTLFFEIARIIKDKRPSLLLLENVKGLLNHAKGETFRIILQTLDELGYDCQWQVLNSKNFGVPQNRERVFIIGHIRGQSGRQVFPIGTGNKNTHGEIKLLRNSYYDTDRLYSPNGIARTMRANAGGKGAKAGLYDISPCIRAEHHNTADVHFIGTIPRIRRLTPTECERLQGFPDGWTKGLSDAQRYKCLGNAVTTNVITEIGEKL